MSSSFSIVNAGKRYGLRTPLCLAALALALAGCTVSTPEVISPIEPLPAEYYAARDDRQHIFERRWERLGDPRLNAMVDRASSASHAVLQAAARMRLARAQAGISRAEMFPQFSGDVNASRQRQNLAALGAVSALTPEGVAPGPTPVIVDNYGLSIDISWELDLWGRLSAQSQAALADFLASRENLRAAQQTIAAQASRLYFYVIEARAQLALAERTEATVREIMRQITIRANAGVAPPSDRLLANANLASVQAGLVQRRGALARATRQLEILLRDYPPGSLATADELPAELLVRRPDVRAQELNLPQKRAHQQGLD
jgi:multidrug efflux system outer membrane protein